MRSCLLALGAVICVHLSTLSTSPTIWQDEAQIVDWGRTTWFEPHSSWSLSMLADGQSVPMLFYVGPLVQEIAYRAFAPHGFGPRLSTLCAAVLAVCGLFYWLVRRGNTYTESFVVSGLLFLEPSLMASYRGARVDALAMAVCFWTLALARSARIRSALAIGAGFALAAFVWPSSTMLTPLALAELYEQSRSAPGPGWRACLLRFFWAGIGAALVAGLLLGVLLIVNPDVLARTMDMLRAQFGSRPQTPFERLQGLWATTRTSPLVWVAVSCVALRLPQRSTALASLAVLLVLLGGMLYAHRVLYLMPCAALITADALRRRAESGLAARVRLVCMLALVPAFAALGVRTALALDQRKGRDPDVLREFARRSIGRRDVRVAIPFQFYFAGRELGWHMLRPYGEVSPLAPPFASADYVIIEHGQPTEAALLEAGMRQVALMPEPRDRGTLGRLIGAGAQPYGGFAVLSRLGALP